MSWALWAVSPGGDVGGILKADWISVEEEKMKIIRKALAPLLPSVTQEYLSRDPSDTSLVVCMWSKSEHVFADILIRYLFVLLFRFLALR